MTPKEKAKELVSKMRRDNEMPYQYAKQCAVIAVMEIINSNPCCEDSDRGGNFQWASNEYFWQEVKQEINKIQL
jgi:hypothetical protein